MTWDVVGVGASCVDHVCRLPEFPAAGAARSKIRLISETRMCGGQTATALAACSALGLRAKYVGAVGSDADGEWICRELQARGIDVTDVVRVAGAKSATATILIDDSGDRIVLWNRNPALALKPEALPNKALNSARLVHVDDVDEPSAIEAARAARLAGVSVTCDLDHVTERTGEFLSEVSTPIFAEHVPLQLTGESNLERALRALRQRHPGVLVVTLGERGAAALDGSAYLVAPGFRVDAVDTTGAGDVFRAGFIYGCLNGMRLPEALRFANAAAAAGCLNLGAMGGVPSLDAVRRMLERGEQVSA